MTDQVQMQPPVQVVTHQVMAGSGQQVVVGGKDWSSGTFDCFSDIKSCLCGMFCTMCFACKLAGRLDESCCVPVCGGGVIPMRVKTRMLFGIHGDICNDCVMMSFCGPCALCQMSRELDANGWHH